MPIKLLIAGNPANFGEGMRVQAKTGSTRAGAILTSRYPFGRGPRVCNRMGLAARPFLKGAWPIFSMVQNYDFTNGNAGRSRAQGPDRCVAISLECAKNTR